jgi:heterodisulfide reductase subunit B
MSEMKTAAYICSGCGLGDKLDVSQLSKIAQKEGKMALVREHDFLCNTEGVQMIRDIVESAYYHGAEMIVTPCQLCQANVEIYQSEINKKKGTKLAMPVVYYSQLMTVAYGGSLKEAGLDGHVIQPERLQKIAERKK